MQPGLQIYGRRDIVEVEDEDEDEDGGEDGDGDGFIGWIIIGSELLFLFMHSPFLHILSIGHYILLHLFQQIPALQNY